MLSFLLVFVHNYQYTKCLYKLHIQIWRKIWGQFIAFSSRSILSTWHFSASKVFLTSLRPSSPTILLFSWGTAQVFWLFPIPSAAWRMPLTNCPRDFALSLVLSASCLVCSPSAVTLVAWWYKFRENIINEQAKAALCYIPTGWIHVQNFPQARGNQWIIDQMHGKWNALFKCTIKFYYLFL